MSVLLTHKDLRSRVVHIQGLEDGRAIIGDHHLLAPPHALQDLVLHPVAR